MKFEKAKRSKCKMKLSISGASGSGKTYSALKIAKGIVGNLSDVAVVDSENGSSNLYSHLGNFSVLSIDAPYSPEKYMKAIDEALKSGFKCLIIDSLSHEWFGTGGVLDIHSQMEGNSFTNWSKLTPRHNALIHCIVSSPIHIIATLRSKTEYVIQQKNGKSVPEKVGMKAVQREDSEYEFTIAFELNKYHVASVSKDRTELFNDEHEITLNENVGKRIADWCETDSDTLDSITDRIRSCKNLEQLHDIYSENPEYKDLYRGEFAIKQEDLIMINQEKFRLNGSTKH